MFNCSSVITVYPAEEFNQENFESEDTVVEILGEIIPPTQSFFPTVPAIQNSLESLQKLETPTLLPFVPNVPLEVTSASSETPSEGLFEHTEGTAEEPSDVAVTLETITLRSHGGEAEPEEYLTTGKTPLAGLS